MAETGPADDGTRPLLGRILHSKLFWIAVAAAALVGLYAFLGFRVAPGVVRNQAIEAVRETYGRELQIGALTIHPFKLQLDARDIAFPDRDGKPMLGLRRLFVDFELSSIWRRAFVFQDVIVEAPAIRAVLRPDGAMNLADLAPPPKPGETPPPAGEDEGLPAIWIQSLVVSDGGVDYVDQQGRATPFETRFSPVAFSLKDFRTTPEGGDFALSATGESGARFEWRGRFALAPRVSSEGGFAIRELAATRVSELLGDALPFALSAGSIGLGGTYRFALGEAVDLKLQIPEVALTNLALRARGADADWVQVPKLTVADIAIALPEQTATIARVAVENVKATGWLDADGSISLLQLVSPTSPAPAVPEGTAAAAAPAATPAPAPATKPPADESPWTVKVASIELTDAAIEIEDRMQAPAKDWSFAPVNLRIRDASLDLSKRLPVTLDATINGHAKFAASGTLAPDPLAAELDVSLVNARMQILQPYVLPLADLTISAGLLNVKGKATLAPPDAAGPEIGFSGDLTIDGFKSTDNTLRESLVDFRRLQVEKIRFEMGPDSLRIDRIAVRDPYARVIISPEQVLNISAVLDPQGTAAELAARRSEKAAQAAESKAEKRRREAQQKARAKAAEKEKKKNKGKPQPAPAAAPPPPDTFPIRIREVRVDGGRMNFSDLNIQPNFSAEILQLKGSITGLSSAFTSRAKVDLAGNLGEFSPVTIGGELQPFAFDRFSDITLKFENISLPVFNPYSGAFAGYNIAKGKLDTDLRYQIDMRKLNASHKIRIDQLEWGEATATQGEATLPVKFATSLLKDRNGVIALDVPVTGTLDDPKLRIGPIVWQVIKNLIVKAVTAPFALLGSLFKGAEEAQFIDFAPGEATLDAATAERLGALAKGLVEKPAVSLDIPIGALPEIDRPALERKRYQEQLAAATRATIRPRGRSEEAPPAPFETLEPGQKIEVLTALVKQQAGAVPQMPEPPPPAEGTPRAEAKAQREAAEIEFLEKTARGAIKVQDADFAALGQARGEAIERALLTGTTLEPSRVFLTREGKISAKDGKTRFELGLK